MCSWYVECCLVGLWPRCMRGNNNGLRVSKGPPAQAFMRLSSKAMPLPHIAPGLKHRICLNIEAKKWKRLTDCHFFALEVVPTTMGLPYSKVVFQTPSIAGLRVACKSAASRQPRHSARPPRSFSRQVSEFSKVACPSNPSGQVK